MKPLVSISCSTYNHVAFISQCLDGFLIQKCTFDYEILIYDDASTDGTSDIIREYQNQYPNIIKPIIQTENQYSKGVRGMMPKFNFPRAQGKYLALCEGDDYWTDPLKLQKQVDFLEANEEYSFCFHDAIELYETSGEQNNRVGSKKIDTIVDLKSVLIENNFSTASLVVRAGLIQSSTNILSASSKGDYGLVIHFAEKGLGKYFPEAMSTYRMHEGGVWSSKNTEYKLIEAIKFYDLLLVYFKKREIRKVVVQKRNKIIESQSLIFIRKGQFWKGLIGLVSHRNFTTDNRLKGASTRKILSAIKTGLLADKKQITTKF